MQKWLKLNQQLRAVLTCFVTMSKDQRLINTSAEQFYTDKVPRKCQLERPKLSRGYIFTLQTFTVQLWCMLRSLKSQLHEEQFVTICNVDAECRAKAYWLAKWSSWSRKRRQPPSLSACSKTFCKFSLLLEYDDGATVATGTYTRGTEAWAANALQCDKLVQLCMSRFCVHDN